MKSFDVVQYVALFGAVLAIAALIAAFTRASFAKKLARASTVVCAGVVVFWLVWLVRGFDAIASAEATSKATILAETISHMMNCTAILAPSLLIGAIASWIARRRTRAPV